VPAVLPSRVQAAFNQPTPPVAQCQLPPQSSSFGVGRPNAFGSAPSCRAAQVAAPAPTPKTLSSAADYGAAAAAWKPPTAASVSTVSTASVARKPEAAIGSKSGGGGRAAADAPQEWECRRCTFLNNGALWECEMCGFERPGKEERASVRGVDSAANTPRAPFADDDAGWKPAGRVERKAAASAAPAASGKSKAQAKNEKRRAKKRED